MEEEIITPEEEVFDYHKLRYILGQDGYICHASLGGLIVCDLGECTEYTGEIPNGYSTIEEWYDSELERLNAWKIVDGNLVFDEARYAQIQKKCAKEAEENRHVCYKEIKNITSIYKQDLYEMYKTSESEEAQIVEVTDANKFEAIKIFIKNIGETVTGNFTIKSINANMLPNDATSKEESGISFAENEDKSITLNGTATADIEYLIAGTSTNTHPILHFKKNIDYFLSSGGYTVKMYSYNGTDRTEVYSGIGAIKFTDEDKDITQIVLSIPNGTVIDEQTIYLMLNTGTEAEPYVMHDSNETIVELGEYSFEPGDSIDIENGQVKLYKEIYPNSDLFPSNDLFPRGAVYDLGSINNMPLTYKEKTYVFAYENTLIAMKYPNTTKNLEYENTSSKNGGFSVDEEGNVTLKNATVTGGTINLSSDNDEDPKFRIYDEKNTDYAYLTNKSLQIMNENQNFVAKLTKTENEGITTDLSYFQLYEDYSIKTEEGVTPATNYIQGMIKHVSDGSEEDSASLYLSSNTGTKTADVGLTASSGNVNITLSDTNLETGEANELVIRPSGIEVNGVSIGTNSILTAMQSDNQTIAATNAYEQLNLIEYTKIGNALSVENGGIKIGKGVSFVKVSYHVHYNSVSAAGAKWATLYKNDVPEILVSAYLANKSTIASGSAMITVNEGDNININVLGTAGDVIRRGTFTMLTVEVVG